MNTEFSATESSIIKLNIKILKIIKFILLKDIIFFITS